MKTYRLHIEIHTEEDPNRVENLLTDIAESNIDGIEDATGAFTVTYDILEGDQPRENFRENASIWLQELLDRFNWATHPEGGVPEDLIEYIQAYPGYLPEIVDYLRNPHVYNEQPDKEDS